MNLTVLITLLQGLGPLYCPLMTTSGEGMLNELFFEITHLSWILDFNFESTITLISQDSAQQTDVVHFSYFLLKYL